MAVNAVSGRTIDDDRFPEWRPFADAVKQRRPDAGTWRGVWTVGALTNADLWAALTDRMATLTEVVAAADPMSPGTDDVVVDARTGRSSIRMDAPVGPANPSRICSRAGQEALGRRGYRLVVTETQ